MKAETHMRVRPAPRVDDPEKRRLVAYPGRAGTRRHLDEAGEVVPKLSYWMRRLACGDVEPLELEVEEKPAKGRKRTKPNPSDTPEGTKE